MTFALQMESGTLTAMCSLSPALSETIRPSLAEEMDIRQIHSSKLHSGTASVYFVAVSEGQASWASQGG